MNNLSLELIKILRNSDINIENALNHLFVIVNNQICSNTDLEKFSRIYNEPLIYKNIGLTIEKYDKFTEMISPESYKKELGYDIVKYSYKYHLIIELKNELKATYQLVKHKFKNDSFQPCLDSICNEYKKYYEKLILETYYTYYLI